MMSALPPRSQVDPSETWNAESTFATPKAWEAELDLLAHEIGTLEAFRGQLVEGPSTLLDFLTTYTRFLQRLNVLRVYAVMNSAADTTDQQALAQMGRVNALSARVTAASAFCEPEILALPADTLESWMRESAGLAIYRRYFSRLEQRRPHVQSAEVERVLGLAADPIRTANSTHALLANADMRIQDAIDAEGRYVKVTQGTLGSLLTHEDRELRRTAWEHYADAHLALKNAMANSLAAGVKSDVFFARARGYASSLDAALRPAEIPLKVFQTLIDTFRENLPIWHRYWGLRRRALGLERLREFDTKAPLTPRAPVVPWEQAVAWVIEGMAPLGDEYVSPMRRGLLEERWVDRARNLGKRMGAFSTGAPGIHPFIHMSYGPDLFSMSTLAHELGHSMHSYLTNEVQPLIYTNHGLFIAEVASNFNQALVREYLLKLNIDPEFQIAVLEEAMANVHRYLFIMPTLARFELEIHERVERGEALTADSLTELMAELLKEAYGPEVDIDAQRSGIPWAQFSGHLYMNFYVYQYATGISGAQALAARVLSGVPGAREAYLAFLRAGSSLPPLEVLRQAGVDLESPEPVKQAFITLENYVSRLEALL